MFASIRIPVILWCLIAFASRSFAQTPAFEVASVKPSDESKTHSLTWKYDDARVTYTHANLKGLMMDAFPVAYYQLDAPSWFETQHYDLSAKIPEGATQEQVPAMLQALLTERFRMVLHRETRNEPAFALVVGKTGARLKRSDGPGDLEIKSTGGRFEWHRATVARFAQTLSGLTGRPVVDTTGLTGTFDIVLELNAADLAGLRNADPAEANPSGASIFAALQAIGLKLESRRLPIEHLVVDEALRVPVNN